MRLRFSRKIRNSRLIANLRFLIKRKTCTGRQNFCLVQSVDNVNSNQRKGNSYLKYFHYSVIHLKFQSIYLEISKTWKTQFCGTLYNSRGLKTLSLYAYPHRYLLPTRTLCTSNKMKILFWLINPLSSLRAQITKD